MRGHRSLGFRIYLRGGRQSERGRGKGRGRGSHDKVSAVVGRDAAVGLTDVVAAVELKQQRVEVLPL